MYGHIHVSGTTLLYLQHLNTMYVLLTKHQGNPVQYTPERRSREGTYQVRYCPCARSITRSLHARLGYQHFSILFFVVDLFWVKVQSVSCNIGPAERAISRNMDQSRMSGIGKLHDGGHVPCNKASLLNSNPEWSRHILSDILSPCRNNYLCSAHI